MISERAVTGVGVPGHPGLCLNGLVPDRGHSALDRILAAVMESQESPLQHFRAMTELAVDLRTLPAQILEHAYSYSPFGSWWTTLERKGIVFRIVFDGKERQLRLERAGSATEANHWEALDAWPARDGESAHAMREVVARLRAV